MPSPSELNLNALSLGDTAEAARTCTACDLYRDAPQVIFGGGPPSASLMFIGEQPGDQEDREGEPFVGPAGRQLDRVIKTAGVERSDVYVTNVVKPFRFEERGKKRLQRSRPAVRCKHVAHGSKPSWRR